MKKLFRPITGATSRRLIVAECFRELWRKPSQCRLSKLEVTFRPSGAGDPSEAAFQTVTGRTDASSGQFALNFDATECDQYAYRTWRSGRPDSL
jgi:hypothetical protein